LTDISEIQCGIEISSRHNASCLFCFTSKVYMLCGFLSLGHDTSLGCRWRKQLQIWRVGANILNMQLRTAYKEWSSNMGVLHGS